MHETMISKRATLQAPSRAAIGASLLMAAAAVQSAGRLPAQAFDDPAPPEVRPVPADLEPPSAADWPGHELVFELAEPAAGAGRRDWPTFLGPRRDGQCDEAVDLDWGGSGPRLVWSVERGEGYAAPSIRAGRLVYTHRVGSKVHIDCLEAHTGRRYWRHEYPSDYSGEFIGNQGPRATPTIDAAGRVFVHGVEGMLHCLDLESGHVLWKRDLMREFGLVENFFGVVSSPLVVDRGGKDVLVVNLGAPGGPCVAAFDCASGKLVWGSGTQWGASCASPVFARDADGAGRLLVLTGGKSRPPSGGLLVLGAQDGEELFRFPFRSRTYYSVNATSPLAGPDLGWVFLSADYGMGSVLLTDGEDGPEVGWKERRVKLEFSNALWMPDGVLYAFENRGSRSTALLGLDPGTGDVVSTTPLDWTEEVKLRPDDPPRPVGATVGRGSLLGVGDRMLCLSEEGTVLVLRPGKGEVAVESRWSPFRATETWTPPVVCNGLLYLCQNNREPYGGAPRRLLCYDVRR